MSQTYSVMDINNDTYNYFNENPKQTFNFPNFDSVSNLTEDIVPDNDLENHTDLPYNLGCQITRLNSGMVSLPTRLYDDLEISSNKAIRITEEYSTQSIYTPDSQNNVKMVSLSKLKESTNQLLNLLDGIKKTHPKCSIPKLSKATVLSQPVPSSNALSTVIDLISSKVKEDIEIISLDANYEEDNESDDCSVYKRLIRKCHCLNRFEFNDFIIHFNESTKYFTSTMGEIIKNMRILKKFLYMGGDYTRHALIFLNEGLAYSAHVEKVEITQGCAYADICNVFDDQSIVIVCMTWQYELESYCGNPSTQALTASFLNKLIQLEEGRRYLKFSSKITSDLKKLIRKNSSKIEFETLELLNATLNVLSPPVAQNVNVTYYCKPIDEGFGCKTVSALENYRQYMTLEEVFTHLDLLHNLSNSDNGRNELISFLPTLLNLFTQLLKEYDNSEMNIILTNILNNIVSRSLIKPLELPRTVIMADTATESVQMKHEMIQIPPKKSSKKDNKSKVGLGMPLKFRQPSKGKVKGWEPPITKSKKFINDANCSVIVVPIEE